MPRVFVACHDPSRHGKVTWEGHDIVGYVDQHPGTSVGDAPYFKGWDSIPASLHGTIDIVLAMYCPVALSIERGGDIDSFAEPPSSPGMWGNAHTMYEITTEGFKLLKPGGFLLFPRVTSIAPQVLTALEKTLPPGTNTAKVVAIPKPRWIRHRQDDNYNVNKDYSVDELPGVQVTKGVSGGRRRKSTRRNRRRKSTRRR